MIGPELKCLEGEGQNSNVSRDKSKIPMCKRIKAKFQRSEGHNAERGDKG